ncbi:MAG: glycosyltransferase family 4 protein [Chitinophagaceae bacterium]|nr:glycosyltransferase family 4 protein [Chitinophagaceae bacterium]
MKILLICEEYPPGKSGGIGTMVQTQAREMVRQGHDVYVVGLYMHGYGQSGYEEDNGVRVWRLRYYTDIGLIRNDFTARDKWRWRLLKWSMLLQIDTLLSVKRLFRFIHRLIREEHIDIIEMPDWNTFFQHSFIRINIPRFSIPLMVKFNGSHSYFLQELGLPVKKYVYASEYALMRRAEALSSVSQYTAAVTARLFHIERSIKILYNTIHLPDVKTGQPLPNIIFTGSLIYKKGIHSLLKAWNIVAAKFPGTTLDIFGKGDVAGLHPLLSSTAAASVNFRGHVPRDVLFEAFSRATAAVFPSYSECFAFAPLEAMGAGCAVINTSRASGGELVTNGVNGLLIDPDDIQQIAQAILLLLEDAPKRASLAAAGKRTIAEQFTIEQSVPQHIEFYKKIISGQDLHSSKNRS